MTALARGNFSIGMGNAVEVNDTLPAYGEDPQAIIDFLLSQVSELRTIAEGKADAGKLKTLIQFSDEAIRIQAENIAMVGAVTFLDVWRDQTGQVIGGVHPSLTRIRGGVVQTGQIISNNWSPSEGTAIDLDTSEIWMGGSSAPSLYFDGAGNLTISGTLDAGSIIADSVTVGGVTLGVIKANAQAGFDIQQKLEVSGTTVLRGVIQPDNTGAIAIGSITWNATTGALTGGTGIALTEWGIIGAASGVAKFTIEAATGNANFAGTLTAGAIIAGSVTIGTGGGETVTSIQNNAQAGYNIQQALTVSGTTVLRGVLQPDNTGAIAVGTITWNSTTGALTGGTGVAITEWGIIGAASGAVKFSIEASTGNAVFAGTLSAATGTFAGSLSAATGTFAGSLSAATGTFSGSLSAASGTFAGTISTSGSVLASGSVTAGTYSGAVVGSTTSSSVAGIYGRNTHASGIAVIGHNTTAGTAAFFQSTGGICVDAIANPFSGGTGLRASGNPNAIEVLSGVVAMGNNKFTKTRVAGQLLRVYAPGGAEIAGSPFEYQFE